MQGLTPLTRADKDILRTIKDKSNPFYEEPFKRNYKVYNDGGHYIATVVKEKTGNGYAKGKKHIVEDYDILFDSLYVYAVKNGYKNKQLKTYIKQGILQMFPCFLDIDEYIEKKLKRKYLNLHNRKKRFRRKANLNKWNYFVTFTYDDKKHNAETFRKKLRKCLSNLKSRRNWRYMGVFEYAPNTNRLHFHALFYIPDGEMIGNITQHKDYNTTNGSMQTTYSNDFFEKYFGRNDFKELNDNELKTGQTLNYILKYIAKTGERIVYSRGIATDVVLNLAQTEIVTQMQDFVVKYILFDDTVDWFTDVMGYKMKKQISLWDIVCNS